MKQLVELQSLVPANHRSDTVVIGVSSDPMDKVKSTMPMVTEKTGAPFAMTLLSDDAHKVIDLYGLRNNEDPDPDFPFIPFPTTYVIDSNGKVRWKFTEKNQAVRPSNETILTELKKVW